MITLTREEAQQVLDALIWTTGSDDFSEAGKARVGAIKVLFPAIETIRARLSAPEPEPISRTCTRCQGKGRIYMGCDEWIHCSTCNETGVIHTAPPQRDESEPAPWRGLTSTERKVLWLTSNNPAEFGEFIEAKLREKNERRA
jgi:hypothetical protein